MGPRAPNTRAPCCGRGGTPEAGQPQGQAVPHPPQGPPNVQTQTSCSGTPRPLGPRAEALPGSPVPPATATAIRPRKVPKSRQPARSSLSSLGSAWSTIPAPPGGATHSPSQSDPVGPSAETQLSGAQGLLAAPATHKPSWAVSVCLSHWVAPSCPRSKPFLPRLLMTKSRLSLWLPPASGGGCCRPSLPPPTSLPHPRVQPCQADPRQAETRGQKRTRYRTAQGRLWRRRRHLEGREHSGWRACAETRTFRQQNPAKPRAPSQVLSQPPSNQTAQSKHASFPTPGSRNPDEAHSEGPRQQDKQVNKTARLPPPLG